VVSRGGAAHGTIYFKMLDDAAFYAANTLVTDRFLLTTSFNLLFSRPVRGGGSLPKGAGSAAAAAFWWPRRG
jgi:acyl-coenzyme A thioesterase PaaI-like protein